MPQISGVTGYFDEPAGVPNAVLYYNTIANKVDGVATVYEFRAQYKKYKIKSALTQIVEIICL